MIVLIAELKLKPGKLDAFIEVAQSVAPPSRKEAGCVSYKYFVNPEDETF